MKLGNFLDPFPGFHRFTPSKILRQKHTAIEALMNFRKGDGPFLIAPGMDKPATFHSGQSLTGAAS